MRTIFYASLREAGIEGLNAAHARTGVGEWRDPSGLATRIAESLAVR
jgi:hypothetical protein